MNILLLHRLGPRHGWLASVADVELAALRYSGHRCLAHDAHYPLPSFVKELRFDAVLVSAKFISLLQTPSGAAFVEKKYAFLRDSPAVKLAFPQDDYWCSEVRDAWFTAFKFDKVYPVCPREHWAVLYPGLVASGAAMELGYTSYVTPRLRARAATPKPRAARRYDVVYRARGRPAYPNRLGTTKAEIGTRFEKAAHGSGLNLNIATGPHDRIVGDRWLDFVEDSRAVLGSNSGSSVLVRNHATVEKIKTFVRENPGSDAWERERACFPECDRQHVFTAISPRNLEAGLLETLQVLVPGPYSGFLEPWQHYVPLAEDCSNIEEVMACLRDSGASERIARSCRERLLTEPSLQIETHLEEIGSFIMGKRSASHQSLDAAVFDRAIARHRRIMRRYESLDFLVDLGRSRLSETSRRWLRRLSRHL